MAPTLRAKVTRTEHLAAVATLERARDGLTPGPALDLVAGLLAAAKVQRLPRPTDAAVLFTRLVLEEYWSTREAREVYLAVVTMEASGAG
jgi:hypothetical protein